LSARNELYIRPFFSFGRLLAVAERWRRLLGSGNKMGHRGVVAAVENSTIHNECILRLKMGIVGTSGISWP
jgi:hypothetical protein